MAAGEDVRGREATLGEERAVRAPANELELRLEAGVSHLRLVAGADDVIVAIKQHRRRPVRCRDLAGDDRGSVRQIERAESLHTALAQQTDDRLVRLEQYRSRLLGEARR